jgi:hypothetical protein
VSADPDTALRVRAREELGVDPSGLLADLHSLAAALTLIALAVRQQRDQRPGAASSLIGAGVR